MFRPAVIIVTGSSAFRTSRGQSNHFVMQGMIRQVIFVRFSSTCADTKSKISRDVENLKNCRYVWLDA